MRIDGFKHHHATTQKLFLGGLKRVMFSILIVPLMLLLVVKILIVAGPIANMSTIINTLIYIYFYVAAAITCIYVITHYTHIQKSLKPVSDLAQFGDRAAKVAHDLRSPLAGVQTAVKSLQKTSHKNLSIVHSVALLEMSVRRLVAITDDLLGTHTDTQERKQLIDLHQLLNEMIHEFSSQRNYTAIQFKKNYTQNSIFFQGHEAQLARVFQNLFKNSMEAMNYKGSIHITTDLQESLAIISMTDSGPGMNPHVIQKVLAGPYTEGKSQGHGLGLAYVREFLEKHGGQLTIESSPGQGACFLLKLPQKGFDQKVAFRKHLRI